MTEIYKIGDTITAKFTTAFQDEVVITGVMKANKFVKKYGWDEAKKHLEWMTRVGARRDIHGWFMDDLKRLVESYELINSLGGIEQAKSYAIDANACGAFNDENKIKQTILDVESCK